jgi:Peptidase M50B-like
MTNERAIAAYHEAGHAVVGHMLGSEVRRVSIGADSGGLTRFKRPLGFGERAVLTTLAGPYAQKRYAPRSHWRSRNHAGHRSSGRDFDYVIDLIFDLYGTGKVADRYSRFTEARAEALVDQHWSRIEAVAKALLEHGEITGDIRAVFPQVH